MTAFSENTQNTGKGACKGYEDSTRDIVKYQTQNVGKETHNVHDTAVGSM